MVGNTLRDMWGQNWRAFLKVAEKCKRSYPPGLYKDTPPIRQFNTFKTNVLIFTV